MTSVEMVRADLKLIIFICLILQVVICNAEDFCPYQECTCSGQYINCQSHGFDKIPPLSAPDASTYPTLRFGNNKITEIPDDSLPAGVTKIDFENNPISDISSGAFNNTAATLETLSFTNTRLTRIPDAFLSLQKLKSLTIKNSPLRDWNLNVLQHIGSSLQELVLNNVGLTSWPVWIQYFPILTTLSLTNMPLHPIPDTALDLLKGTLNTLTLASANLLSVPVALTTLTSLTSLDLTNNSITDVENLPYLSQLKSLSLGTNKIADVYKLVYELSPHSATLNYLYLHDNLLSSIPRLAHISNLDAVNLSKNRIKDPKSGSLPSSIYNLNLNDNQLSSIPNTIGQLNNLNSLFVANNSISEIVYTDIPSKLSYLDIQNNAFYEIRENFFPLNSSLTTLYFDGNPIISIAASAFKNISALKTLGLRSTHLTRVPLAFSTLTNLSTLDIRNNTGLVCTCQESGLVTWFQSLPHLATHGSCGDTSLSEFFTNLAPQCPELQTGALN